MTKSPDIEEYLVKSAPQIAAAGRQTTRILLAEDNRINQEIALRQLRKLGFEADTANDGNEVLAALQRAPYDLILMDCQMPELDGYEATARIRREHPGRIHIIAMTAHAMQGDRDRCLRAGMDDYVAKPVRTDDLRAALDRWLRASAPLTRTC